MKWTFSWFLLLRTLGERFVRVERMGIYTDFLLVDSFRGALGSDFGPYPSQTAPKSGPRAPQKLSTKHSRSKNTPELIWRSKRLFSVAAQRCQMSHFGIMFSQHLGTLHKECRQLCWPCTRLFHAHTHPRTLHLPFGIATPLRLSALEATLAL